MLSVEPDFDVLAVTDKNGVPPPPYMNRGPASVVSYNYYGHPSSCQGTFIYIVDTAIQWDNRVSVTLHLLDEAAF
jgi:hypothetical protein